MNQDRRDVQSIFSDKTQAHNGFFIQIKAEVLFPSPAQNISKCEEFHNVKYCFIWLIETHNREHLTAMLKKKSEATEK